MEEWRRVMYTNGSFGGLGKEAKVANGKMTKFGSSSKRSEKHIHVYYSIG